MRRKEINEAPTWVIEEELKSFAEFGCRRCQLGQRPDDEPQEDRESRISGENEEDDDENVSAERLGRADPTGVSEAR